MLLGGYIKLFRQFSDWEWYKDTNTKSVFIHCLISANFKEKKWEGVLVKRGQFISSLAHLADEIGLSVRNVRTCLDKLEKTGEITVQSTSKFSIITICKFDSYQTFEDSDRQTTDTVLTSDRQTTDIAPTSDRQQRENVNNDNKENNEKNTNTPVSEISILKVERMWHQEIETYSTYSNLHPELKTAVRFYLDDQEEKEKRGITTAMVKQTLLKVQGHLGKFDYKKVAVSLYEAVQKSNKDFNPAWNKPEATNQNTENGKVAVDWVMGKAKIQTGKV